jgi:carboxylesterase type B
LSHAFRACGAGSKAAGRGVYRADGPSGERGTPGKAARQYRGVLRNSFRQSAGRIDALAPAAAGWRLDRNTRRDEAVPPGRGQSILGAFHSLEIPYVFGTLKSRSFTWLPFDSTDEKLSQIMQSYWTNFAKSGDPNGAGVPKWVAWNADQEPYMAFSQGGEAVPQRHFSPIYCHLSPDRLKRQLANY